MEIRKWNILSVKKNLNQNKNCKWWTCVLNMLQTGLYHLELLTIWLNAKFLVLNSLILLESVLLFILNSWLTPQSTFYGTKIKFCLTKAPRYFYFLSQFIIRRHLRIPSWVITALSKQTRCNMIKVLLILFLHPILVSFMKDTSPLKQVSLILNTNHRVILLYGTITDDKEIECRKDYMHVTKVIKMKNMLFICVSNCPSRTFVFSCFFNHCRLSCCNLCKLLRVSTIALDF